MTKILRASAIICVCLSLLKNAEAGPISKVEISDSNIRKFHKNLLGVNVLEPIDKAVDYVEYSNKNTFEKLGVESVRYPGGSDSQEYLWKSNCILSLQAIQDAKDNNQNTMIINKELEKNSTQLRQMTSTGCHKLHGAFADMLDNKSVGLMTSEAFLSWIYSINSQATVTFTVNIDAGIYENKISQYATYAGEWFEHINTYADNNNLNPVLNWEIGNEIYYSNGASVSAKEYSQIYKLYHSRISEAANRLKKKGKLAADVKINIIPIGPVHANDAGFLDYLTPAGIEKYKSLSLGTRKFCKGSDDGKDKFIEAAIKDAIKFPHYKIEWKSVQDAEKSVRKFKGSCGEQNRDEAGVINFYNNGAKANNPSWWSVLAQELKGFEIDLIVTHIYDNSRVKGQVLNMGGSLKNASELIKIRQILKSGGVKGELAFSLTEWNVGSPANKILTFKEHVAIIFEQFTSYIGAGVKNANYWPLRIGFQKHGLLDVKTKAIKPAGTLLATMSKENKALLLQTTSYDVDVVSFSTINSDKDSMITFIVNKSSGEKWVNLELPNKMKCESASYININETQESASIQNSSIIKKITNNECRLMLSSRVVYFIKSKKKN